MSKSTNDVLYERALEAIQRLFNDNTVLPDETRTNLEMLIDEIDIMLESLPEDDTYDEE